MKLLVNIRGANGSGKSTIPMSMMDDTRIEVVGINAGKRPYITLFPTYGWLALGTYKNKTGGLDTYKNNAETYQAMVYVLKNFPEYNILMEGIIASTIKSTYAKWFNEFKEGMELGKYPKRTIIIMSLTPPLKVCLERIQKRNGGKPIKEDQVASKWDSVDRNVSYFKGEGFISIRVNNSTCSKEGTLDKFLKTCGRVSERYGEI